jgi:hypothetical protein
MSLLAALFGCQPEAPAQPAAPAAPSPAERATPPAAAKAAQPPEAPPAAKPAPASGDLRMAAAEQAVTQQPPAAGAPQTAESGTALKGDDLKAEPFNDAQTVATLAAGERVDILGREGGWYQVKSARGKGWVRMLSIRKGDAPKGGSDASGVLALASGRAGTGKVVATTGIRGLNEEELKAAKFDEAELKRAESYATGKADAARFAAAGKLAARPFDYLPAPK